MAEGNEASNTALERADAAAERIEEWRSHLLKLASSSVPEIPEISFLGRELRAAATVAAMAELEALLRDMLVAIATHVNHIGVTYRELQPSLRPLAANSTFTSLADTQDRGKIWAHRLTLTSLEDSNEVAILPQKSIKSPQPPLDGRTIQPRHISLVWSVLNISNPIPSAAAAAALMKLTQIRNDVAHRNLGISDVFSEPGRTATHIAQYLDEILLLVIHIGFEWASYVDRQGYLRHP